MDYRFEIFSVLVSKASKNMKKIKNKKLEQYGLKIIHASILYYLYANKSLTATELCEKCDEDKATISRGLDYLEDNKFLVCNSKHLKKYNSPYELTEKGLELGKQITNKVNDVLSQLDGCLTEEERNQFYESFYKITNELNYICENLENEGELND